MHPKKWGPNTIFDKDGLRNQIFCMQSREIETKNKLYPCFAKARYLLTKLCNIFVEAFLFDVSIFRFGKDKFSHVRLLY